MLQDLKPKFARTSGGGKGKPPEEEKPWDALATRLTASWRKNTQINLTRAWQGFEQRHHPDGKLPLDIMGSFKSASSKISTLSSRLERGGVQAIKALIDAQMAIKWLNRAQLTPQT